MSRSIVYKDGINRGNNEASNHKSDLLPQGKPKLPLPYTVKVRYQNQNSTSSKKNHTMC